MDSNNQRSDSPDSGDGPPQSFQFEDIFALFDDSSRAEEVTEGEAGTSYSLELGWRESEGVREESVSSPGSQSSTCSSKHPDWDGESPGEGQGEIDEGFDEEFCDGDVQEEAVSSKPSVLEEVASPAEVLTLRDIQHLLAEGEMGGGDTDMPFPQSSLLEDFDPGVDVLDSEHSSHNLLGSEALKSPTACVPSPYHTPASSPIAASGMDLQCMSMGPYGCFGSAHSLEAGPSGVLAGLEYAQESGDGANFLDMMYHSGPSPMSASVCDMDIAASLCGYSDCQSTCGEARVVSPSPTPSLVPSHAPSPPPVHSDIMLSGADVDLNYVDIVCSSAAVQCGSSSYQTTAGRGCTLTSAPMSTNNGTLPVSFGGSSVKVEGRGGVGVASCTVGSQTCAGGSPGSSILSAGEASITSCASYKPTSEGSSDEDLPDQSKHKLIDMPFYQFKKILDDPAVPENKKSSVKNIRRRGKNKRAAKMCRQRKMEILVGLQEEIDQLKARKTAVAVRARSLEHEIAALRKQCIMVDHSTAQS